MTTAISETLSPSELTNLSKDERQAYIKKKVSEAFGMVKVKKPKGFDLFEFDVSDHITLFDED